MQFDDFINRVQEETKLGTREEAIEITRAVLETLGERLDRKVRNGVAAQLPDELKEFLLARSDHTDRYGLIEFYNRVGARADLKHQAAVTRTGQVVSVLRQAIPEGEIQDILEDLPDEYEELFEKKSPSPGS
jgi:uncharacterized protein (DUF2267 family)